MRRESVRQGRTGIKNRPSIDFDPNRPTRTGPLNATTASALLMNANPVPNVMLGTSTLNASAHSAMLELKHSRLSNW